MNMTWLRSEEKLAAGDSEKPVRRGPSISHSHRLLSIGGREASMFARPHITEPEAGDLPHLDLLAALGDAVSPVVAIDVLERLVARIADAAMHLHGAVGRLAAQAVSPVVAHRDAVRERALDLLLGELVHLPGGLADQ